LFYIFCCTKMRQWMPWINWKRKNKQQGGKVEKKKR
jgi:hypothetical protein